MHLIQSLKCIPFMEQLPSKGIQVQCTMDYGLLGSGVFPGLRAYGPQVGIHAKEPTPQTQVIWMGVPNLFIQCAIRLFWPLVKSTAKAKVLLGPQAGTYDLVAEFCATFEESTVEEERHLVDGECILYQWEPSAPPGKITIVSVAWHWWRAPPAPCQIFLVQTPLSKS